MNNIASFLSYAPMETILRDLDELSLFISRTGAIISINRRGSEILGISEEEISGKNWFVDYVTASCSKDACDEFHLKLNSKDDSVFIQDYQVICKGEVEKLFSLNNRIVKDNDDIVMCVLVSGHETRTETAKGDENQTFYKTLVEKSNDAIIIHKDGIIRFVNNNTCKTTGYTEDELIGLNFLDLITDRFRPIAQKHMISRITGIDSPSIYEIEILNKSFNVIPAEINVSSIQYDGERVFMVIARDLSDRRHLEEQLLHSQKMEAIGRLAGGVAHDFNNILQVITGYTELAQSSLDEDNPVHEMLLQISQAGERAGSLVKQLLTFSRNQLIVTRILKLDEAITEHLDALKRVIGENINLEFFPSCDNCFINSDQTMLGQILLNICLNARDSMPEGGNIQVKTAGVFLDREFCKKNSSSEPGEYAMISVSDTGCGMDKETLSRIFEPFFSTKGITAGTGLGLSTVYGIVNQHDGIITAESERGKGSTFEIYIPLAQKTALTDEESSVSECTEDASRTIVITEDDENVRHLVSDILSDAGHEVITAANGEEAVLLISDSPDNVDLVVLDVIMPVLGGYEAADQIREIRPNIPIIFCSGYNSKVQDVEDSHRNLDRSRFLPKPYSIEQLLHTINELLAESRIPE